MKRLICLLIIAIALCLCAFAFSEETSSTVENQSIILFQNQSYKCDPQIDSSNIEWSTTDASIATVSKGIVKGIKVGECDIVCNLKDDNGTGIVYHVEVRAHVQSVVINEKNIVLLVGADDVAAQCQLTYSVKPENAYYQSGVWTSSDENVVVVDSDGKIKGISSGKATITFTSDDPEGKKKAQVNIKVNQAISAIALDESTFDIPVGKSYQIKTSIEPNNATNKKIEWSTSNEMIVKVNANGQIRGISPGTAKVTASASDGSGVSISCQVTVYTPLANREDGDYIFFVDNKQNVTIVKYKGNEAELLVVPDMIAGKPVICIAEKSFERCPASKVVLPGTLKEIGYEAFYYAETKEIVLPDTDLVVKSEAFMCSKIVDFYIPAKVSFEDYNPFRGCKNLRSITVDPDNKQYAIYENALVVKKTMELIVIPYGLIGETLVIPDGIKIIGNVAFGYEVPKIKELYIPDSVHTIKSSAFAFSPVQYIEIGSGVTKMDYGPFTYCKSLQTVIIKDGTTTIGRGAFSHSENLKEIYIPNSVKQIANSAFEAITLVKIITNPNSAAATYAMNKGINWAVPTE